MIRCGGDTDTTGAIVGGIIGAGIGPGGMPSAWLAGIAEWPCGVAWMERVAGELADAVATGRPVRTARPPWPLVVVRNGFFLAVVLAHGFRRLLPPW